MKRVPVGLSFEQRAVWGSCPTCEVTHGIQCLGTPQYGNVLGQHGSALVVHGLRYDVAPALVYA